MFTEPMSRLGIFEATIKDYFGSQAYEYIVILKTHSNLEFQKLHIPDQSNSLPLITPTISKSLLSGNATKQRLHTKMNVLGWLARCQGFLSKEERTVMTNAYRDTELPLNDKLKTKHYYEMKTGSDAMQTTCTIIQSYVKNMNLSNRFTLTKLYVPMKILELLLHNEEQRQVGLKNCNIVLTLCKVVVTISNSDQARKVDHAATVAVIYRTLNIVMLVEDAQLQFGEDLKVNIKALLNIASSSWELVTP